MRRRLPQPFLRGLELEGAYIAREGVEIVAGEKAADRDAAGVEIVDRIAVAIGQQRRDARGVDQRVTVGRRRRPGRRRRCL
ncbi:MAG: hypothetical protein FJX53_05395, partial [Alphaproteobacteria bacterium]|nr:hypothetical protein [Alphaproteobacteria bacterium]